MKGKARKTQPVSARRHSLRTLIGVVSVTLLLVGLVGVVSAVSMQGEPAVLKAQVAGRKSEVSKESGKSPDAAGQKNRHYVTTSAAGQAVVLDRQTGDTRPLTPQEAATLAEGIKQLVNQTTDGLVEVRHAGGGVSMDLQGHFQNVMLAKKEADGTVSQSCVNDLETAADFFEIDPALLGIAAPVSKSEPSSSKLPIR
jgi:hypothetical protein